MAKDGAFDKLKPKMQTATLVEKTVYANGRLGVFKLKCDAGDRFWYKAGQYISMGLDTPEHGFVVRAYSIAGSPLDHGIIEFYIALVDNGHLTPTIFKSEVGAKFHYLKPVGKFTLEAAAKKTVILVATGTGLAPFVSHVRTLWKLHQSGVPVSQRIVLFYGSAYADELVYRQELEGYAADDKFDFTLVCSASRPDPARGWTPATGQGRINEVVRLVLGQDLPAGKTVTLPTGMVVEELREMIVPAESAFMTCGNPGMIEDLKHPAEKLGISPYLVEEYWKG
jgi:ferredoxin-NADP reductase